MSHTANIQQVQFKDCLQPIPVPSQILKGIKVTRVDGSGKTSSAYLTLAEDKFTILLTKNRIKKNRTGNTTNLHKSFAVTHARKKSDNGTNTNLSKSFIGASKNIDDGIIMDVGCIVRIQSGAGSHGFKLSQIRTINCNCNSIKEFKIQPSKCFSIICVGGHTVNLVITDVSVDRDNVIESLKHLMRTYAEKKTNVVSDVVLLKYIWFDVDKDQSGNINQKEFFNIFRRINYKIKESDSNSLFKVFTKKVLHDKRLQRTALTFEQCAAALHKVRCDGMADIISAMHIFDHLFEEGTRVGKQISADSFLGIFLLMEQGETKMTIEKVRQIFCKLNQMETVDVVTTLNSRDSVVDNFEKSKYIDYDRFDAYLMSEENDIFDPEKEKFDESVMDRPLSEFWINTSHNTYLSGDQLLSYSSVDMYTHALYQGYRCVELDCWDGEGMPIIYHGHTLTSIIPFFAVIGAIKDFLNENPDCFPIILSLENHCSIPFQDEMAKCMVDTFKASLYVPPVGLLESTNLSADMLKGKVLIKGKRILSSTDNNEDDDSDSEDSVMYEDSKKSKSKVPPPKVSSKLSAITYIHARHIKNFKDSEEMPPICVHSFNEAKVKKYCKKETRDGWMSYNRSHLTRTYPHGKRLDSSNYNPILAWSVGSQLVAMNVQTPDSARRLNDGRFRENGGCGYVLKPQSINSANAPHPQSLTIHIKVICGSCLPKPEGKKTGECIDPFVQVHLFDIAADGTERIETKHCTSYIKNNGFNPVWDQRKAFKYKIQNPDVAMLQFTVLDKDIDKNEFIASSSVPVSCIRQGYRSVKLFDEENTRSGPFECASLLVEVEIELYHETYSFKYVN